ncbi:FAD-dependent monooxygenase [Streptomyces sp. NPDC005438]|uniref:FAD-dependent oxidoreductase n=1 Tax=Streptomyces sp. NPDC005438 TaxID=3156880 RepID=UPI0033B7E683
MQHAIVLGGSIAGLFAARVLRDHARVTVVEPEAHPTGGARPGVPQAGQVHVLLGMGQTLAERWFPGLTKELQEHGAVIASGDEAQAYTGPVRKVTVPGFEIIGTTRRLLETRVRERVLGEGGVTMVTGKADGLLTNGGRVTGVRYRTEDNSRETLTADLVVDATGRSSRLGRWLEEQGWPAPEVERMRIDLGYATVTFRRGDELPDTKTVHALPGPPEPGRPTPAIGAITAVEDQQWMMVLAAYGPDRPGNTLEEFRARCHHSAVPAFAEIADHCEPLSDVDTYTMTHSMRRHFTKLDRFPGGLVVVGDAMASFNPVYGQGMTCAALHASCLNSFLRSGRDVHRPARRYFDHTAVVVDAAWRSSAVPDLAQPTVDGPYPRGYPLLKKTGELIAQASITDPWVNARFMEVLHMHAHPNTLSKPRFLYRVAQALRDQRAAALR